jgi:hypothetical protein
MWNKLMIFRLSQCLTADDNDAVLKCWQAVAVVCVAAVTPMYRKGSATPTPKAGEISINCALKRNAED